MPEGRLPPPDDEENPWETVPGDDNDLLPDLLPPPRDPERLAREEQQRKLATTFEHRMLGGDPVAFLREHPEFSSEWASGAFYQTFFRYCIRDDADHPKRLALALAMREKAGAERKSGVDNAIQRGAGRMMAWSDLSRGSYRYGHVIDAYRLLRDCGLPPDDDMRRCAVERLRDLPERYPDEMRAFADFFGVPQDKLDEECLRALPNVDVFAQLRRGKCIDMPNSDPRLRKAILADIAHGLHDVPKLRLLQRTYEVPEEEFRAAVGEAFLTTRVYREDPLADMNAILGEFPDLLDASDDATMEKLKKAFSRALLMKPAVAQFLRERYGVPVSPKDLEEARTRIPYNLRERNIDKALEVAAAIDLPKVELQEITRTCLRGVLWAERDKDGVRADVAIIGAKILTDDQVDQAMYEVVEERLQTSEPNHVIHFVESCRQRLARPLPRLRDVVRRAALQSLRTGKAEHARGIVAAGNLAGFAEEAEAHEAAFEGILHLLRTGELEKAVEIRDTYVLEERWKSIPAKRAAMEGVVALLEKNDGAAALALRSALEIEDEMFATCVDSMMKGGKKIAILRTLSLLPEKPLQKLEREWFLLEYKEALCVPGETVYARFVELRRGGDPTALRGFVGGIHAKIDALVSSEPDDPALAGDPYYRELIAFVYPNNSGGWTNFESNESCPDRTADLARFVVRDSYAFTVRPGEDMRVKEGQQADNDGLARLQAPVRSVLDRFAALDQNPDRLGAFLDEELVREGASLAPPEAFRTREEKLFGLLLESGVGAFSMERFKELLITYHCAVFPDIRDYLAGTRGRAEQAKNPEYVYLLELHEFFADRLKEVARKISEEALKNSRLKEVLPEYHRRRVEEERQRLGADAVNRLQIDKLGLSDGFLKQIARTLKQRTNRKYTPDEVRALIEDYEARTDGLAEAQLPDAALDPVVYMQIRAQRTKTIQAIMTLSGVNLHPAEIRLGAVNLTELLTQRREAAKAGYSEELFAHALQASFQQTFAPELAFVEKEIAKYEPVDGPNKDAKPKRVEGYITLNRASAHARGTAGVCVSGDNPRRPGDNHDTPRRESLWMMPNYLQLVLRDAATKVCQGCVLLHLEEVKGKRILMASLNPCSTYLYQVNETEMFSGLVDQLATFAKDNRIHAIGVSKNKQIRTNRTGGEFERAMDGRIATVNKKEHLGSAPFCYVHSYQHGEVDVIWTNPELANAA